MPASDPRNAVVAMRFNVARETTPISKPSSESTPLR
jgi:hypothetical protein